MLSVPQAYVVLGLDPTVDREIVHTTYRKLALQHHPDRNPGDSASLERFKQLTAAYRVLQRKFHTESLAPGQMQGECDSCGNYALLRVALDGSQCCVDCLSRVSHRRMLPAPPIVIASCAATVVLLILAAACLLLGGANANSATFYYALGLGLGVSALASLAITCVTVIYTAEPQSSRRPHSRPLARVRKRRPRPHT